MLQNRKAAIMPILKTHSDRLIFESLTIKELLNTFAYSIKIYC